MESTSVASCTPVAVWRQLRADWLILGGEEGAYVHDRWVEWVGDRSRQLEAASTHSKFAHVQQTHAKQAHIKRSPELYPLVLIAESDPQQFLAVFWAALLNNWNIALANPRWGLQEWQSVSELIAPTVVWGKSVPETVFSMHASLSMNASLSDAPPLASTLPPAPAPVSQILIPTGGTSGNIKFAHHTWQTLLASVNGFCQYFSPQLPVDSYCVLPLYHVSGLMQVLRSVVSGGQIAIAPFKTLESSPANALPFFCDAELDSHVEKVGEDPSRRFLSLVPTQLQRLLQSGKVPWLRQFYAVLLGGAPPWPTLLDAAHQQRIPLSLSYGMTETAAMVTALKPEDFLLGDRSSGTPLPHATLKILKDNVDLPPNQVGQIAIHASSIALPNQTLFTDDLGYLSTSGQLYVTGRASQIIISGGENISPVEVEAAIRSTDQVKDVYVFGLPDAQWGEAVTAVYVPCSESVTVCTLQQALSASPVGQSTPRLSRYKHPKHWLALKALPRNGQGKLNRQALMAQIQPLLQSLSQSLSQSLLQPPAQSALPSSSPIP